MSRYALSKRAHEDMLAHLSYLSERSSLAVERLALSLIREFRHLAEWPGSGRKRPDLTSAEVYFWPLGAYWIIYRKVDTGVLIARIVHSKQELFAATLHAEEEA